MTNELENGMPAGWETDVVLRRTPRATALRQARVSRGAADAHALSPAPPDATADGVYRLAPEKGASEREDD